MKVVGLAITAFAVAASPVSDASAEKLVRVGGRMAANTAAVDMPEDPGDGDSVASRFGVAAAGFIRVALGASFDAEIGVGFSQRGYRVNIDNQFVDEDPVVRFDYLEVPVTVAGHFATGKDLRVRGVVGVSGSVLARANFDEFGDTRDLDESLKKTDVALIVGGGLEWDLNGTRLAVELRHEIGLRNVALAEPRIRLATGPIRNRVIALVVAAAF